MQSKLRWGGWNLRNVARLDRAIVRAVSRLPEGRHDVILKNLSEAATQGKLWFAVAGVLGAIPGKPRNAAIHGLLALGVASAVTNLGFKKLLPRARPLPEHLPVFRFVNPQPTSSSMPSGHSASAVAFAVGVALVHPRLGAALAPVAAGVAYSRVHTGAHWPSDVLLGSTIGAGAALLTRTWWPLRPPVPDAERSPAEAPAIDDGEGLSIAVNALGGSYSPDTEKELREIFPQAHITVISEGQDIAEEIRAAALRPGTRALGVGRRRNSRHCRGCRRRAFPAVAGAAGRYAQPFCPRRGCPFVGRSPQGRQNGSRGVDRSGPCECGPRPLLPAGFGATDPPVLDDGVLDIRMVTADEPFARLRLLWAVLTGTTGTSKVTHLSEAGEISIEAVGEPLVIAVDGEPLPGVRTAEFTVRRRALKVYSPLP